MDKLIAVLKTALPVFLALAMGMLCRKKKFLTREGVDALKKVIINLTLPFALFASFATAEYTLNSLIVPVIIFVVCTIMLGLGFLVIRLSRMQSKLAPFLASGFEAGMLGIPLESTAWEGKTYTRFADRFVCDDRNLVATYLADGKYTDGLPPVEDQLILGDIINGVVPGRVSEDEFVITSSHGIALSDVAVGKMILEKAEAQGVGTMLTLMEENDILR